MLSEISQGLFEAAGHTIFPSVQLHSVLPGLRELLDCDSRLFSPTLSPPDQP